MRLRLSIPFVMVAFVLVFCLPIFSQQAPPETIEELTAAVQKLEAIDKNPATPVEIRELNRGFLAERRAKLLTLLVAREESRRQYLSMAMSALTPDQIVKVEREIIELDAKIKQLQSSATQLPAATGATSATTSPKSNPAGDGDGQSNRNAEGDSGKSSTNRGSSITGDTSANVPSTMAGSVTTGGQGPTGTTTTGGPVTPATQGSQFKALLGSAVNRIQNEKTTNPHATIDLRNTFMLLAVSLTEETRKDVVADFTSKAEQMKTDKQAGASQGSGATTSLVTKAGIPAIFGFAVENGALTRTENKTGITFSGTPVGIIETLGKKGYIESYQKDDGFDRFLRNFSFKISFDPNRGSTPGTFTASGQQLTGYSLRYKLIDQRDPRDKKYTSQWSNLVETQAVPVTATLARFFTKLFLDPTPAFAAWKTETEAMVAAAAPGEVETVLAKQLEKLRKVDLGTDVNSLISTFSTQFDSFLKSRDDILDQVNAGWSSTIEYNNERRPALPSLSNIKFIAEKGAYNGSLDLTANASLTFLNSKVPGTNTNTLRDFRFAGQLDVPLGNVATTGKFFLSFAGLYERLVDNETLSNGTVVVPKGDIATGQVKLTIPIRGTAFKIPLSFSFANRTELIKEKHVKGSFGFTFDLDSILAKFNPFTQK